MTLKQTQLWHELAKGFKSRAPGDSAFDKAFAHAAQICHQCEVDLIAIGAGVAEKEFRLVKDLVSNQATCSVTFIDISTDLLSQAQATFAAESNVHLRASVSADIASSDFLIDTSRAKTNAYALQIFTLFGVLPGLVSNAPLAAITNALNPGDLFLLSFNLMPEHRTPSSAPPSLKKLATFYDSPAARAWLQEILHEVGLNPATTNWQVTAEPRPNDLNAVATLTAQITTQTPTQITWHAKQASLPARHHVEVFRSHRHTPKSAADLVQALGLELVDWQVSPSGEEGVALTRLPA
ncbi:MAG: hypothetical protein FJW50_04370 [Actinobacteria bacterium]|nr:hypothetical protein [Actinomycetota bacterium]